MTTPSSSTRSFIIRDLSRKTNVHYHTILRRIHIGMMTSITSSFIPNTAMVIALLWNVLSCLQSSSIFINQNAVVFVVGFQSSNQYFHYHHHHLHLHHRVLRKTGIISSQQNDYDHVHHGDDDDIIADTKKSTVIPHQEHYQRRRKFLQSSSSVFLTSLQLSSPVVAYATATTTSTSSKNNNDDSNLLSQLVSSQASSTELESGLLESRVVSNVINPPPYGMEGTDIFYPSWFAGAWKVRSETVDVQAPCGIALFGGNTTYINARKDIGNVLNYNSRFITSTTTTSTTSPFIDGTKNDDSNNNNNNNNNVVVIADREYNVKSIARVAMGENSVVDVAMSTPNQFSCIVAPKGSPTMLSVDLIVLNRRQENTSTYDKNTFDCSEVVREIVSSVDRPANRQQPPSILKEIETISLYTYDAEKDIIHCKQRSATFLLPSNTNPLAMRMWEASRGRAIDVRFYDVEYQRIKR